MVLIATIAPGRALHASPSSQSAGEVQGGKKVTDQSSIAAVRLPPPKAVGFELAR